MKINNKITLLTFFTISYLLVSNNLYGETLSSQPALDYNINVSQATNSGLEVAEEATESQDTGVTLEASPEDIEIQSNDPEKELDVEVEIEPTEDEKVKNKEKKEDGKTGEKPLAAKAVVVNVESEKLDYNQENDTFTATGNAKVIVDGQEAELTADKVIYYQKDEYITAEGNLQIIKDGKIIKGDFARVNLSSESALVTNPNTIISNVKMTAKEANLYPELIELEDGSANLQQGNLDLSLSAGVYRPEEIKESIPGYGTVIPSDPQNKKPHFRIVAKEIELDRAKKVNNLIVKNASVYIGKFKIATMPRLTLTVGEQAKIVEAMLPEVGFNKNIAGIYFGPSLTLDLPRNSLLRISPIFAAAGRKHVVGGGGIARFRTSTNTTDVAYTSTADRLVLKGEQRLYKDTTKINYLINEYPDKGFMGTGFYRPLYLAELVDERKVAEVLNHDISTRISGGIARDVNYGIATPRVQFQGNIISNKPILHLKDYILFRLQTQVNVAYYGTGDFYTVLRGGPRVDWNLGRLSLTTSYFQAGIWGDTPFVFDEYIRGKSNLILAGDFRLCKYLSVGNIRSLNLLKDGPEPRLSTENQFYARVGPEDFKFRIGYDVTRKRSLFGIDLFLGAGRSGLNFDKLKVLHPDAETK